jgi:hypothetical protein
VTEHLTCIECGRAWDWERPKGRRGAGPPICSDACREVRRRRFAPVRPKVGDAVKADPKHEGLLEAEPWPWPPEMPPREPEAPQAAPGPRIGRPPHEPTLEQRQKVQSMAGLGSSVEEIALIIGISQDTVRLRYRDELIRGPAIANRNVAQNLYRIASTGAGAAAVAAAWRWLCARDGWSDILPAAPRLIEDKPEPLGKKAEAEIAAQTAEKGTSWADLIH